MASIDLNSDLGEGFGAYTCGDDAAMLDIVTSANVACGFHAGDPDIMARTFRLAKDRSVAIGAHPGFRDLEGFGRRRIALNSGEIERMVAYQIGAAQALAVYAGHRIAYVKAHGALANWAEVDESVANAVARAVRAVDARLALLCIAASAQVRAAEGQGLRAVAEVFADRGYTSEGRLIPRGEPGAMIVDADAAAGRLMRMIEARALIAQDGTRIPTPIDSVCVHGDSPRAVAMARRIRVRLEAAGYRLAAFAPVSLVGGSLALPP